MQENLKKYSILEKFNVSRETCIDFERFVDLIITKNSEINLISKKSEKIIRERHIIDCAQAIDFIELNDNICTDIGTGGGFPGVILAIITKNANCQIKFNFFEKSYHKSLFLKQVSKKLNLNAEIFQKDVFEGQYQTSGTVIARAFKPLPVVLELINKNFINCKNLIVFMGKNGKQILKDVFKQWDFEYKEKKSLTSDDSFLLSIKNIKKKN